MIADKLGSGAKRWSSRSRRRGTAWPAWGRKPGATKEMMAPRARTHQNHGERCGNIPRRSPTQQGKVTNTEQDQRVRKLAYRHGYRVWKPCSDRHWQHKPYRLIEIHTDAIGQSRISLDKIEEGLRDG